VEKATYGKTVCYEMVVLNHAQKLGSTGLLAQKGVGGAKIVSGRTREGKAAKKGAPKRLRS